MWQNLRTYFHAHYISKEKIASVVLFFEYRMNAEKQENSNRRCKIFALKLSFFLQTADKYRMIK